ncbi:transporter [Jeongeupia chitinilytica]|uniref:Magnesium transporter CorA n=1 Tax=Jeongeupia chitinilytica TaxID=1041641 RepID=A0ABQ3H1B0_9NEIS|nr:transporter [Jeongeupia chitinilytica]GHD63686.1 magnesium transporter CorA [Jeongeupia chitinilytica]
MLTGLAHYGADQPGLVCGYHFRPGGPGVALDSAQAADWLARADGGNGFVWLHFNLAHASCERWLRAHLDLPDDFYDAQHEGSSSTRIEQSGEDLLAVVNDVVFSFGTAASETATLWVCTQQRMLVTARTKPLRSIDRLRASVRDGECFRSPAALLVHLLRDQADVLVGIVRETSGKIDLIEDRLLAQRPNDKRAELAATRRVLVRLQRLLALEPGALFRLLNRPPVWLRNDDALELRQATEESSLVLNDLTSLVERMRLLQEELAAQLNEQTNRTLFTLTVVTVLALPINIVAGLFGMNVGGVPLAGHPHGFWLLVAVVVGFTVLAGVWALGRRPR